MPLEEVEGGGVHAPYVPALEAWSDSSAAVQAVEAVEVEACSDSSAAVQGPPSLALGLLDRMVYSGSDSSDPVEVEMKTCSAPCPFGAVEAFEVEACCGL